MSQYCDPSDIRSIGLRPEALAGFVDDQIVPFCIGASADGDVYLRSRYLQNGPLVSWGTELRNATARIAALAFLTWRGFDPTNPADLAIETAANRALAMLRDVQNGRGALDVVMTLPGATAAPRVYSKRRRGW